MDPKFTSRRFCMTPGVSRLLTLFGDVDKLYALVVRHLSGDWGDVCEEDARANEDALEQGYRILSAYTFKDERIWIITEADRSVTTILLPEEY